MPLIRSNAIRHVNRREMVLVAKDPKASGNIHYGRSSLTRFRARVYTFLDHPRYQRNYWYYLSAILYHVGVYVALCVTGLTLELKDLTWQQKFLYEKYGLVDFPVKLFCEVVGMICSVFLVAEYVLRVWSCVSNNLYGGDPKEINAAKVRQNLRRGRLRYVLEWMNILELVITIVTAFAYFVWCPNAQMRFAIFARAIHWDKSVHAWRLIKKIGMRGFRFILPSWGFAFILMALSSCAVNQCELYYRLENETLASSDIRDLGDSLWYTYITAMTIGYGDYTPKSAFCRTISVTLGYCANGLIFSVQTAVSLFLVKHIVEETHARNDRKVQNLAAKVIQCWVRFHLCRRKFPSADKYIETCCQKLYAAKMKIEKQRQVAGMMQPAKRLIKRAKRSSLTRQRSGALDAYASAPPAHAIARKRGVSEPAVLSTPYRLRKVFANRADSPDSSHSEEHDYSSSNQNTVDERFLRMHHKKHRDSSGISSLSRTKTRREEFGPLVMMIQFLLFGHYKRRFRNTSFRKPPEARVADEQERMFGFFKDVDKQIERVLSERQEIHGPGNVERSADWIWMRTKNLTNKITTMGGILERPWGGYTDLKKRKATVVETTERKDSGEQVAKRKNTIM